MKIKTLSLTNIRCFVDTGSISFSPRINVFVGKNNSGKSTILKSIQLLQKKGTDYSYITDMLRKDATLGVIEIELTNDKEDKRITDLSNQISAKCKIPYIRFEWSNGKFTNECYDNDLMVGPGESFSNIEPYNLLVYFLSKRKVGHFENVVNSENTSSISDTLRYLATRINQINNADDATVLEFKNTCKMILGATLGAQTQKKHNHLEAGFPVDRENFIPLKSTGEGTVSIAGLILDLCSAKDKIFLIEELENDLHPEALKWLLELIVKKSNDNQFIISTHSNIVVRYLCSEQDSKLFELRSENILKQTSTIHEVDSNMDDRMAILHRLGYDPVDFGLWSGYLILEEASAESVINQILIPHFVPELQGKVRTISANGVTNVEPAYNDFKRLFTFTHLSEIYSERSWVRVDGDISGREVIDKLRNTFSSKPSSTFKNYKEDYFERYYPERFKDEVDNALSQTDRRVKQAKKIELCRKVLKWAAENKLLAKEEFNISANEIILDLRSIESELNSTD